jgi:vesicle transport protein SEC22
MANYQSESELAEYKKQAKLIFRRLTQNSEDRASIESGPYFLQYSTLHSPIDDSYLIADAICYLTITDKSYPRKLAFSYLQELAKEFQTSYGVEALKPNLRPYAFVQFDTFISATKRVYQDSRAQSNLDRLNVELQDVTRVMTKNIEDLIYRGDSLDRMTPSGCVGPEVLWQC